VLVLVVVLVLVLVLVLVSLVLQTNKYVQSTRISTIWADAPDN
jgi:hypothetical protein